MTLTRKKFKPAVSVCNITADDPSLSRKALSSAAKRKVKEEDDYERLTRLTSKVKCWLYQLMRKLKGQL